MGDGEHSAANGETSIVVFAVGYRWHDLLKAIYRAVEAPDLEVVPDGLMGALARRLRPGETGVVHLNWASEVVATSRRSDALRRAASQLVLILRVRSRGYHVVWTVHNDVNHAGLHVGLERRYQWILAHFVAERIVALSEFSATRLRQRWGRRVAGKIRVIPLCTAEDVNGPPMATTTARAELGLSSDRTVLLVFGRVSRCKGLEALRSAIAALPDLQEQFIVCIVGQPGDPEAPRAASEMKSEFRNVVVKLERIEVEDVRKWLSAADWLVLPYDEILNSGVAMLALTYRVPVIAPRIGALPEVFSLDGAVGGLMYEAGDPAGLSDAFRTAVSRGGDERQRLASLLAALAERHSPALVAGQMRTLYEELRPRQRRR